MIPVENGAHDARQANQSGARVAVALRDGGRATVAQLAERTGLSRPTVEAALPALRERGLVDMIEEHTAGGRGAGRPARIFEFVADAGLLVGVDVGIHRVRVVVADLTGRIVAWHQRDIEHRFVGADRLDYVKDAVRTCFDRAGLDVGRLATLSGMAVAVSGMVGPDGRLAVSHNFPDWEGVDIAGRLREEFGCTAAIENDMRLAALAEHRMGAARLVDDVAYFFAGHRISMGLIIDGKLRRGRHGAAGEIGGSVFSMHVDDSGQLRWETAETAEEVFRAAAAGDAAAQAEIERFVRGVATGIATVTMAVDPDVVVVGGGLSRAGEELLRPLRAAVMSEIGVPVRPSIIQSELGAESVVLGALALASGQAMERLYLVPDLPEPDIDVAAARTMAAQEIVEEAAG
ncbi:ROK family protein [Leifsonia shinshuensis]|uniref:ROK family transcriptional regulator n=1 Tax=Leifsonia shinshuensis TaxID=150026 RepID=UPI001F509F02|nr:ROK family transcriptional regulator [Leifsonia shinshuensis]MCI0155121.1 ROK family protein [Leifsonia shinshuensis]